MAYLVIRFDVELDLFAGEGSYSTLMSVSVHIFPAKVEQAAGLLGYRRT